MLLPNCPQLDCRVSGIVDGPLSRSLSLTPLTLSPLSRSLLLTPLTLSLTPLTLFTHFAALQFATLASIALFMGSLIPSWDG